MTDHDYIRCGLVALTEPDTDDPEEIIATLVAQGVREDIARNAVEQSVSPSGEGPVIWP